MILWFYDLYLVSFEMPLALPLCCHFKQTEEFTLLVSYLPTPYKYFRRHRASQVTFKCINSISALSAVLSVLIKGQKGNCLMRKQHKNSTQSKSWFSCTLKISPTCTLVQMTLPSMRRIRHWGVIMGLKGFVLLHRIILGINTTMYLWISYQETWRKSLNILHYSKQLSKGWKTQVLNYSAWSKNRMSCCISIFWVILFFTVYHNMKWQVKTFIDLCH